MISISSIKNCFLEKGRPMVMLLSHEHRFQVMMEEWRQCESGIRGLDAITFKIRAWVVTLMAGLIIAATRFDFDVSFVLIIGLVFAFYFIDTMVNSYKDVFIVRMEQLSEFIGNTTPSSTTQINSYRKPSYPDYFKRKLYYQYLVKNFVRFDNWCFYFLLLVAVLCWIFFESPELLGFESCLDSPLSQIR